MALNRVEMSAKTVEDAVKKALAELNAAADDVEIEVLEEEKGGFLGIGQKARVLVSLKTEENTEILSRSVETQNVRSAVFEDQLDEAVLEENVPEASHTVPAASEEKAGAADIDETVKHIQDFLNQVLVDFGLDGVNVASVEIRDGRIVATVNGDDCGILIGRRGETLRSLQYICSLLANKTSKSRMPFSLDIGGYREKREDSVASLALRTATRAVRTGQAYELSPMSAAERRLVHETLQDFAGVTTYSEGEEPQRYVVIDLSEDYVAESESAEFMETNDAEADMQ